MTPAEIEAKRAALDKAVEARKRREADREAGVRAWQQPLPIPVTGDDPDVLALCARMEESAHAAAADGAVTILTTAELDAMQAAEVARTRAAQWAKICPAVYAEPFDPAKSRAKPAGLAKVRAWRFGPRGLYVIGATGSGKSRSVGTQLTPAFMAGVSVRYVDGVTFAIESGAHMGNPTEAIRSEWMRTLRTVDVLWIDDFAKRWTEATEEAAFAVVEWRTARKLPIIITTNYSGDEMRGMAVQANVMEPMIRRLKEFCDVVIL